MASAPLFEALRLAYNDEVSDGYWGHKTSTLNFCEEVRRVLLLSRAVEHFVIDLCSHHPGLCSLILLC